MSLGETITEARKRLGLSQKDLARSVRKTAGGSITPQYLNDIEHNRRTPSSPEIIEQLAKTLKVDSEVLYYKAGTLPRHLKKRSVRPDRIVAAFGAFRKELEK